MGFLEVLQIIFIVLKLINVIEWSWFVVLIPLYVDITLYIIILLVYILINILS